MRQATPCVGWSFVISAIVIHKALLVGIAAVTLCATSGSLTIPSDVSKQLESNVYVKLARDGYRPGDATSAFYPLLPLLIRALNPVLGGNDVVTGMLITNVSSVVGILLFYKLVLQRFNSYAGVLSVLFLLSFPGAIFFSLIYSESIFFLETIWVFLALAQGRPLWAAPGCFLMPLTRPIGIFISVVVVCWAITSFLRERRRNALTDWRWDTAKWLLVGVATLAGFACYLALMSYWTGDALEGFKAQRFYHYQPSIANVFNVPQWGSAFFDWGSWHGVTNSIIDRSLFLGFVVSLYAIWKLDRMYLMWAICAGLIPPLSNCFAAYSRYVMMVFPLFIVLALQCERTTLRWPCFYYLAVLFLLQAYFVVRFATGLWIG